MERTLRVALVSESVSERMGAERVVEKTRKYLLRAGVQAEAVDPRTSKLPPNAFDVVHFFGTGSDLRASLDYVQRARRNGIPVVASPTLWPFSGDVVAKALHELNPSPRDVSQLLETIWKSQLVQIKIIELASIVVTTSVLHAERVNEVLSFFGRGELVDAEIVPNCVDPEEFEGIPFLPWEERLNQVVTLARVELWKNHPRLIEALHAVKKYVSDLHAVFAGRQLISLALPPWISSLGEIPPRLGHILLGVSKVHAMPSFGDFPGLSHLEALAMGCQVVASSAPYCTISDYAEVFQVDPKNPASIALGIMEALRTPPRGLRELILDKFNFARAAEALIKIYRKLV